MVITFRILIDLFLIAPPPSRLRAALKIGNTLTRAFSSYDDLTIRFLERVETFSLMISATCKYPRTQSQTSDTPDGNSLVKSSTGFQARNRRIYSQRTFHFGLRANRRKRIYKAQTRAVPFFSVPESREWYTREIYGVVIKIPSASWSRNDENNLVRGSDLRDSSRHAFRLTRIRIFSLPFSRALSRLMTPPTRPAGSAAGRIMPIAWRCLRLCLCATIAVRVSSLIARIRSGRFPLLRKERERERMQSSFSS